MPHPKSLTSEQGRMGRRTFKIPQVTPLDSLVVKPKTRCPLGPVSLLWVYKSNPKGRPPFAARGLPRRRVTRRFRIRGLGAGHPAGEHLALSGKGSRNGS